MLYEKEFALIRQIYDTLPEPQQETAKMAVYVPAGATAFGLVLAIAGAIGFIGLLLTVIGSALMGTAMMFLCVDFAEETGIPALKRHLWARITRRPVAELGADLGAEPVNDMAEEEQAPLIQLPANDAAPVSLAKDSRKTSSIA